MRKLTLRKPESITFEDSEKLEETLVVEPKLDGARMIVQKDVDGMINIIKAQEEMSIDHDYGVQGISYNTQFPEIVSEIERMDMPRGTSFLGEMVCYDLYDEPTSQHDEWEHGSNFWTLASRIQTSHPLKIKLAVRRNPATFVVFDTIEYEGVSCDDLSYHDRRSLYASCILEHWKKTRNKRISFVPQMSLSKARKSLKDVHTSDIEKNKITNWLDYVCRKPTLELWNIPTTSEIDLEGVVIKEQYVHTNKRREYKLKMYQESTFRIVGIESKSNMISSLRLFDLPKMEDGFNMPSPRLKYIDRTTKYYVGNVTWHGEQTEAMKKELIGKFAVVRHMITNQGKLRFPSLLAIKASNCVNIGFGAHDNPLSSHLLGD